MRRVALYSLCLALSGCGYSAWWNAPFSSGNNPNMPVGNSENMQRVTGTAVEIQPLTPEPGDIWPGPPPPEPTLQELEQAGGQPAATEKPVPGSPLFQGTQQPPYQPPPPPARGSSTPPTSSNQPGPPKLSTPAAPTTGVPAPAAPNPGGQVYQTQKGPGVTSGGTSGYQTLTTPGGGSAIVIPNGNGTSTIIHSDGAIETVPTPR
jgi:hypothetical protein